MKLMLTSLSTLVSISRKSKKIKIKIVKRWSGKRTKK